ncbi:hypothetical protein halTADL_2627 [Halohasta litchfieldiae]|jgi:hypothetical protein|uniref:Uncharacterized protein n=1 Tax=Halohasta litchfieldiae TaxID=1073996 RepID=A0A1H6S5F2_9EURY|nr:hypothetical protein [Halohasta litchfieldiae]ATW89354.1 hypothetical protein halTADL_2627 [Halohasta litchfieldiae]SEI60017.1 hypothetical protein SAMN05444271_103148 [Halohasta litchfieldiae]
MYDDHTVGNTRKTERRRLTDGENAVTITKRVSKGERLEIDTGDTSVKLDALLLEGLSWQPDRAAVDELLEAETAITTDPAATTDEGDNTMTAAEVAAPISISSEYSHVLVGDITTSDGDALVVTTPGRGSTITLGVQSLRELAAVEDTYVFSIWFETPFGPEDTPVEGPL